MYNPEPQSPLQIKTNKALGQGMGVFLRSTPPIGKLNPRARDVGLLRDRSATHPLRMAALAFTSNVETLRVGGWRIIGWGCLRAPNGSSQAILGWPGGPRSGGLRAGGWRPPWGDFAVCGSHGLRLTLARFRWRQRIPPAPTGTDRTPIECQGGRGELSVGSKRRSRPVTWGPPGELRLPIRK